MTSQVDRIKGLVGSIAIKAPVRVATTANITLSGAQTIDGIAVVADDRVLVKDQTDSVENGIYDASSSAWVRAADWDGANDIRQGTQILIQQGTVGAGLNYKVATADDMTIGTTEVTFSIITIGSMGGLNFSEPIEIGTWDMDATQTVSIAHGLADHTKIRGVFVMIKIDGGATLYNLVGSGDFAEWGQIGGIGATTIQLTRDAGGSFDSTNFDTVGGDGNRGWMTVLYAN